MPFPLTPQMVYRKYVTDGVPASGEYNPEKALIIQLLNAIIGGTAAIGDYLGAWDSGTDYIQRDIVESGGSLWWALQANTNVSPTEGADWTLLLAGVSVADAAVTNAKLASNAVTDVKVSASAAIQSSKLAFLQAGTDAVSRSVQARLREVVSVTDFGAVLNDTSAPVRTANKEALIDALAAAVTVHLPIGTLYLPDDAAVPIPASRRIVGEGWHSGGSAILGDGNILVLATAGGSDSRSFECFRIANENTGQEGVLFGATFTAITSCFWDRVYCGKALRHISASGIVVDWTIERCVFEFATNISRFIGDSTVYKEDKCYTKNNQRGLQMGGGTFGNLTTSINGVFEGSQDYGILIDGNTIHIKGLTIEGWFEQNGLAAGASDVLLQASNAGSVNNILFRNAGFTAPSGSQTVRVGTSTSSGGTVGTINFDEASWSDGGVALT